MRRLLESTIAMLAMGLFLWGCGTGTPRDAGDADHAAGPDAGEVSGGTDLPAGEEVGEGPGDLAEDVAPEDLAANEEGPGDPGGDNVPADFGTDPGPRPPDPALRLRAAGWLSGDLHQHTTYSDGDDPVGITIRIAESLQSPEFLAFHPEYEGNPIDFMALTDHRTTNQNGDPDFRSESVILIPGEEFGGPGHAGIWGLSSFISHDPDGDGSTLPDYRQGVRAAHDQGALFSMNHPVLPNHLFGWHLTDHDAMEVWNTRWGLQGVPTTEADLAAWEAANGPANPAIRRAIRVQDEGASGQFLRFYEAQLSLGVHVALVGGSDRHALFPMGFPSTWVRAPSRDVAGVLAGIRARHTFVTRSPAGATIEMSVAAGDVAYEMGDEVPVPGEGAEVTIDLRVTRAQDGRVRLVRGGAHSPDQEPPDWPLGEVAFEAAIESDDASFQVTLAVGPGDWVYPVVHEPMTPRGLDPDLAVQAERIARMASEFTESNYAPIIEALLDYLDLAVVVAPEDCDPRDWIATNAQCLPADTNGLATFFLPDWIDRAFNGLTEGGQSTGWSMGALGSAVRFVAPPEPASRSVGSGRR